jgi:hypothetical protein
MLAETASTAICPARERSRFFRWVVAISVSRIGVYSQSAQMPDLMMAVGLRRPQLAQTWVGVAVGFGVPAPVP